jgi:hypothetical protein
MLRRAGVAALVLTGLGLLGSGLQGITRVDSRLELAASRPAPQSEPQARYAGWDCPHYDDRPDV